MIVPAIIPTSFRDLQSKAEIVRPFSNEIHVDAVDGIFANNVSWPYGDNDKSGDPSALAPLALEFALEVDLMIENVFFELPRFIDAGVKRAVIHIESCDDIEGAFLLCRERNVLLGLCAGNDTSLEVLLEHLPYADYVQCMGIAHVGTQGEPFDERIFARVAAIKESFPELPISVDGSVNSATIGRLREAGVTRLVVGSAILSASNPEEAYQSLYAQVIPVSN